MQEGGTDEEGQDQETFTDAAGGIVIEPGVAETVQEEPPPPVEELVSVVEFELELVFVFVLVLVWEAETVILRVAERVVVPDFPSIYIV